MSRQFAKSTTSLTFLAVGLFCGCQKPMGNAANGPFSPAGPLSPATSQPLFPFGPIGGATRVPPPPTGSTQANNQYSSPTAASASMPIGGAASYDSFANSVAPPVGPASDNTPQFAPQTAPPLSANSRSNQGGMPVIDLTAGMSAPQNMLTPYANQAVGSGIASVQPAMNPTQAGWQNSGQMNWQPGMVQPGTVPVGGMQQTQNISVPPGDLAARLRPLETNVASGAIPIPGQKSIAMTQHRTEAFAPSPAWQAVQPASASISQNPPYVSQLPTGPSTDPIKTTNDISGQDKNNSLLWRNPASAR